MVNFFVLLISFLESVEFLNPAGFSAIIKDFVAWIEEVILLPSPLTESYSEYESSPDSSTIMRGNAWGPLSINTFASVWRRTWYGDLSEEPLWVIVESAIGTVQTEHLGLFVFEGESRRVTSDRIAMECLETSIPQGKFKEIISETMLAYEIDILFGGSGVTPPAPPLPTFTILAEVFKLLNRAGKMRRQEGSLESEKYLISLAELGFEKLLSEQGKSGPIVF